jgi:hypothetical protein
MNKLILSAMMVAGMFFGMGALADGSQAPTTRVVQIGFSDAYVPGGFDTESDAYVVVNGLFPNGCYKFKEAKVENETSTLHKVSATAEVSQGMCLMVLVPFTREVRLGKLQEGRHIIRIMNGDGTFIEKTFSVQGGM